MPSSARFEGPRARLRPNIRLTRLRPTSLPPDRHCPSVRSAPGLTLVLESPARAVYARAYREALPEFFELVEDDADFRSDEFSIRRNIVIPSVLLTGRPLPNAR